MNPGDWFMFQSPPSYSFLTSGLSTAIRGNLTDNAPENIDSVVLICNYMTCDGGCKKDVEGGYGIVNINDNDEFFITVEYS